MERQTKTIHLFNCDNTFSLDLVEALFTAVKGELNFDMSIEQHRFKLSEMSQLSDSTVPSLQMDFAVFVVHAHESRLSINEDGAGIGYAKIYRALLQATGDNVIIIIGGDNCYEGEEEENRVVISRWARRKVSSQFKEEYLDGRKSFIFSWDKMHRAIHKEALLYYFNPSKKGKKFEYLLPPPDPITARTAEKKRQELEPQPKATPSTQSSIRNESLLSPQDKVEYVNEMEATSNENKEEITIGVGGQHQDSGGSHLNYREGSVLLETRLHYGKVSEEAKDVVKRENGWQIPEEVKDDLELKYAKKRNARVKFVVHENRLTTAVIVQSWFQLCFGRRCTIL